MPGGAALTGGALTGGGFTRGTDCADREPAGVSSLGSLASGRSRSSVANRLAKKPVSAKTTSVGVSIFRADASGARLLESGGVIPRHGQWIAQLSHVWQAIASPQKP